MKKRKEKRNEQVDILINPTAVESYGINLESLINIVRENNKMVSAGGQDTGDGSFDIKVPGLYETIEDILNTPIKVPYFLFAAIEFVCSSFLMF